MRWLAMALLLAGCGGPLSFLTGGGPNVAANVQAGAENRQAGVSVERQAPTVSIRPNARTGAIRQDSGDSRVRADQVQTVVVNEVPWWVVLVAVIGWLLPSPGEMGRTVRGWFVR